jgi:hypothetical protein
MNHPLGLPETRRRAATRLYKRTSSCQCFLCIGHQKIRVVWDIAPCQLRLIHIFTDMSTDRIVLIFRLKESQTLNVKELNPSKCRQVFTSRHDIMR